MAIEPITGLTYQEAGSRQTDVLQNDELNYVSAWLNCAVLSVGDTAPPGSPAEGDRYIVGSSATGDWATHDDALAVYRGGWQFYAPSEGVAVKDLDSGDDYEFVSAAWTVKSGGGGAVSSVNGQTGAVSLALDDLSDVSAAAPTDGYVLTWNNTAGAWEAAAASGGGGGLTNFTEAVNTSSPNATVPVVSLSATNAATNVDAAILPKGSGAFMLSVPDGTATGGNKRGTKAVDLQRERSANSQIASGSYSTISGGAYNTATGDYGAVSGGTLNSANANYAAIGGGYTVAVSSAYGAIAGGRENTVSGSGTYGAISGGYGNKVSGSYGHVGGGQGNEATSQHVSIAGGHFNFADGVYSWTPGGAYAIARGLYGVGFRASGKFSSVGDAQSMCAVARAATSNATTTALTFDGAAAGGANQFILPNNSIHAFKAIVVVREQATGDSAAWEITGAAKRGANAASTALLGTPTINSIGADSGAATWVVAVVADTTNGGIRIDATGEASHNLKWVVDFYSCVQVVG